MLVDAETLSQRPVSAEVIPRVVAERGVVKHELFASIVELNSGVCESPDEAPDILRSLRRATAEAAAAVGCTIAAAGSRPPPTASEEGNRGRPPLRRLPGYRGTTAAPPGGGGIHA